MMKPGMDLTFDQGNPFFDFVSQAEVSSGSVTVAGLLNSYVPVFIIAFIVTILITPLIRLLAVSGGVVDKPD